MKNLDCLGEEIAGKQVQPCGVASLEDGGGVQQGDGEASGGRTRPGSWTVDPPNHCQQGPLVEAYCKAIACLPPISGVDTLLLTFAATLYTWIVKAGQQAFMLDAQQMTNSPQQASFIPLQNVFFVEVLQQEN